MWRGPHEKEKKKVKSIRNFNNLPVSFTICFRAYHNLSWIIKVAQPQLPQQKSKNKDSAELVTIISNSDNLIATILFPLYNALSFTKGL